MAAKADRQRSTGAGLLRSERPQFLTSGLAEVLELIDPRPAFHHFMRSRIVLFGAK